MTDDNNGYQVTHCVEGSAIRDMVVFAKYDPESLIALFRSRLNDQVTKGAFDNQTADRLVSEYAKAACWSTYLE